LVAAKLTFVKSLAVIAGLGLAGGGVYVATNLDRTPALEKTTVVASKAPQKETPMPVQEALPSAEPLGPQVEVVKPAFAPSHASDNLAQEVAILSHASAELHAGRPASALVALDEHQKLFPTGVLAEERIAARVQVYCALGRINEAKQELAQLAQLSPNSPHEARARKACGFKLSDGE
jgi:hypothetical protein